MESDGNLSDLHGWDGATSTALRNEAHANGVRYILTVVNFSAESIDALVNDPEARANGVEQLVGAVLAMNADGVNIDFESVPVSAKAGLTAFVTETTDAFHAAIPGSYVTVATPAVDWSGAFDYDQLAIHSDGLMIMGYGYHWKNGNPGPISPVTSGDIWGEKTLTWTIEDYFQWGGPENHDKYILGLPFYGRDWPSEDTSMPGTALSSGAYEPYYNCKSRAAALGGFKWDEHSKTSYFMEMIDGVWHQVWCDDGPSWDEKLALVEEYNLQGVGIWALGYDGTTTDYWESISAAFIDSPAEPVPDEIDAGSGAKTEDVTVDEPSQDSADTSSTAEDHSSLYAEPNIPTDFDAAGGSDSNRGAETAPAGLQVPGSGYIEAREHRTDSAVQSGGCSTTAAIPSWPTEFIVIFLALCALRRDLSETFR
jgi:hypothetical protein